LGLINVFKKKNNFVRNEFELKVKDKDKRTILHRAALDQNLTLVTDVISDYISLLEEL